VPSPPALSSAKFSSTGGQLLLTWDAATDRGSYGGSSFACDALLDFPLASAADCLWTTSATLTANLDYRATCEPGPIRATGWVRGAKLNPQSAAARRASHSRSSCRIARACVTRGAHVSAASNAWRCCCPRFGLERRCAGDNVTALGGVLKPYCAYTDCSCWPYANESGPSALGSPDTPLTPAVVYVGAAEVSTCGDITIDASTSTGSGGRSWSTAAWSVNMSATSGVSARSANLTQLQTYLAESAASTDELTVPNRCRTTESHECVGIDSSVLSLFDRGGMRR
jgi:hypothetical protein